MTPTVGRLLADAADRLSQAGVDSPDHDARVLLAWLSGEAPHALSGTAEIDESLAQRFAELVAQRARRVPLQHLTGCAYFRYLELEVGPGVFVPRPETEVMTGWAIEQLRAMIADGATPVVVDLGTGTGAIAKSIATEAPGSVVHAVEVSDAAAVWAARNLAGTGVTLQIADMATALPELNASVDLVAANPPYIPLEAYSSVAPEARDHDPVTALFAGQDGLEAIRVVADTAARLLRPGGLLCVEHAEAQADSAPNVFVGHDAFGTVRDHRDLSGRPRFVTTVRTTPTLAGCAQ